MQKLDVKRTVHPGEKNTFNISFIPYLEFKRVIQDKEKFSHKADEWLQLLSHMCRFNTFSAVKLAGSGHLGTSFSSMEIFTYFYFHELNVLEKGVDSPDRDIFFSSKGHDCPGQYAVLAAGGILPFEKLLQLRRIGGLDGHPDVKIPGIEAHTGSLGMGISKAKGMAFAKTLNNHKGRVFVLTGDGELQEGQIWESLQTTAHQGINNITVIVDHNKLQTDKPVDKIISLRNLEEKFKAFGWHVERCDGHDFTRLSDTFNKLRNVTDKPKVVIADTIKGKGISFMEGPAALKLGNGLYRWHSGAPDDESYEKGCAELIEKVQSLANGLGVFPVAAEIADTKGKYRVTLKETAERVVNAYGEALVELGEKHKNLVVLDADLSLDCGLRPFENAFPKRFIENGIAEQDMVSMAGGLALQGLLPVVNSFGAFLLSRANEQIYLNNIEYTKIIYVSHYAGLIPAGPGMSHQNVRDISLFGSLPSCVILEPCNAKETKEAIKWCVEEAKESSLLRLIISPSPRNIDLPENYKLTLGKGVILREGKDAVIFSYGPVMLNEALLAGELLEKEKFSLKVVNIPWLNKVDTCWLEKTIGNCKAIFTLDNHHPIGGLGDTILNVVIQSNNLRTKSFEKFGVCGYPACGTPLEALQHHKLDGKSLAERIKARECSG